MLRNFGSRVSCSRETVVSLAFWMKSRTYCFSIIISFFFWTIFILFDYSSFKKQKNLVAQSEYNEESFRDLFNYILFYLNVKSQFRHLVFCLFFYQIFFIHLWNIVWKNHGVECGASYFFSCLFHQKNVKKNVDLDVLLKIQSGFGKYFIHSCKDEILYNIKSYKTKRILQFAKMRLNRAAYQYSWI